MTGWLVATLAASSALMLFVLLVREPVRRRFGANVAYALWLLPAARMIFPSFTQTVERIVPAATNAPLAIAPSTATPIVEARLIEQLGGWPFILTAAWLAGAGAMLALGLLTYRAQRAAVLEGAVEIARLGAIRIVRSERISGPLAFGIVERFIAVPLDFDQRFSERQRAHALAHELSHHRSGDLVANTIAFVLLCLQWFNPLAWAAHAAFRFDQEAACDARVLDKADVAERFSYGEAIAKAASGRALLFAGALDRPSTLSRRLTIMTNIPNQRARTLGFLLVGAAALAALPLTASQAVTYIDTLAPSALMPAMPAAPPRGVDSSVVPATLAPPVLASAPAMAPLASAQVVPAAAATQEPEQHIFRDDLDSDRELSISDDEVWIDGRRMKWEELTPADRARVRKSLDTARKSIAEQVARLPQQMESLRKSREQFVNGDFERQMSAARQSIQRAMADLDRQSAILRATGQDPEKMKADMRRSMADLDPGKVRATVAKSMRDIDPEKFRTSIVEAAKSIERIQVKLDRLEGN